MHRSLLEAWQENAAKTRLKNNWSNLFRFSKNATLSTHTHTPDAFLYLSEINIKQYLLTLHVRCHCTCITFVFRLHLCWAVTWIHVKNRYSCKLQLCTWRCVVYVDALLLVETDTLASHEAVIRLIDCLGADAVTGALCCVLWEVGSRQTPFKTAQNSSTCNQTVEFS